MKYSWETGITNDDKLREDFLSFNLDVFYQGTRIDHVKACETGFYGWVNIYTYHQGFKQIDTKTGRAKTQILRGVVDVRRKLTELEKQAAKRRIKHVTQFDGNDTRSYLSVTP